MTRLLRTVHTSARLCDSAANASSLPIPPQWLRRGVRDFTPKGRPVPIRPARTTRVTLPSGYPEPPAYPPPQSYWDESDLIDRKGKPKPHPLWAFFHVPPQMQTRPEGNIFPSNMGSIDLMEDEEEGIRSGRSWTAAELRTKSFEDSHVSWYMLSRERNVLQTQQVERRRSGIVKAYGGDSISRRSQRCRKSMARIKYVSNERRLALIAAGAATSPAPQGVTVPSTSPGRNDPMAAVEASHAIGPVPDVVKSTEGKRTKLSGQEKADEALFEEDEADQAAYEEVQKEEEAAKSQAEKAKEETK